MLFTKVMAHLYCAVMLHKAGAERKNVDAQLRLAIQAENPAPTFASKMAHKFLGEKEQREDYLPNIFYLKQGEGLAEGGAGANGGNGKQRRGTRLVALVELPELSE